MRRLQLLVLFLLLGLFLVPLSDVAADNQDPYTLKDVEPQTIPLWGQRTWAKTEVTVIINAGNGVTDAAITEVERSVDDWNRAIHSGLGGTSPFHLVLITDGKADITIRPKAGGGAVQGMALCKDDGNGFFTNCKLNVSGKAFGSPNPSGTVLSISLQELGHALGMLHSDNSDDVMFGTLQSDPNTVISQCDIDTWKEVMHWLVADNLDPATAHRPHETSVPCGTTGGGGNGDGDGDPTGVDYHSSSINSVAPFRRGWYQLRATITVRDSNEVPVAEGATVTGRIFRVGATFNYTKTADKDGKVQFALRTKNTNVEYTVSVDNVDDGNDSAFETDRECRSRAVTIEDKETVLQGACQPAAGH